MIDLGFHQGDAARDFQRARLERRGLACPRLSLCEQIQPLMGLAEPEQRGLMRETFGRLQARLDQDAEEFAYERMSLKQSGAAAELQRLAGLSTQHSLELFESALASFLHFHFIVPKLLRTGAGAGCRLPAVLRHRRARRWQACGFSHWRRGISLGGIDAPNGENPLHAAWIQMHRPVRD